MFSLKDVANRLKLIDNNNVLDLDVDKYIDTLTDKLITLRALNKIINTKRSVMYIIDLYETMKTDNIKDITNVIENKLEDDENKLILQRTKIKKDIKKMKEYYDKIIFAFASGTDVPEDLIIDGDNFNKRKTLYLIKEIEEINKKYGGIGLEIIIKQNE